MNKERQKKLAIDFGRLHHEDKMFVLPNAWNGGSAKVFEKQGFKAVGTSSAGMAYSMGYADGQIIQLDDLCYLTKQITNRISIPLSADLERGYGKSVDEIKASARKIIEAGAVGFNIEDGYPEDTPYLEDLDLQTEKIKELAKLKEEMDIPFIINARTCACWLEIGDEHNRLNLAIERGNVFADAGADCVFIPGILGEKAVRQLVNGIDAPVNIIANPGFNDFDKLSKIGVKRLSVGSGAARATFAKLIDIAKELDEEKSLKSMLSHGFSYDIANEFFGK